MISGRVWVFGDDINTDVMMPGDSLFKSEAVQLRALFSTLRPDFVDIVQPGDVLVAGRNFGCGSSRPAARSLINAGISCVVADSINPLFFRSCISYGLKAFSCHGVGAAFEEGDVGNIDCESGTVYNTRSGIELQGEILPADILKIMGEGGILPTLERRGLISPPGHQEH